MRFQRLAAFLLVLAACGTESEPTPARNVAGTWLVTFSNMTIGGTEACTLEPITLTLIQTGTFLSGTHTEADLDCAIAGLVVQTAGVVSSGNVGPSSVTFRLDELAKTRTFNGTGSSETTMSGTVNWVTEDGIQIVFGDWSAIEI